MSTPHIRGVTGLLDQILSTGESKPADFEVKDSSIANLHGRTGSNDRQYVPRVVARRGRPSGKAAAAASKEKVTVRITTDLIAAYRDWSWEARAQLSHLVEQALTEYEARHHDSPTARFPLDANRLIRKTVGD